MTTRTKSRYHREPANAFYDTERQRELLNQCLTCQLPPTACDDKALCPVPYEKQPFTARIQHRCGRPEVSDDITLRDLRKSVAAAEKRVFGDRLSVIIKLEGEYL